MKNLTKIARFQLSSIAFTLLAGLGLQACFLPGADVEDLEFTDDSCVTYCEEVNECGQIARDCQTVCDLWEEMDCEEEVDTYDACRSDGEVCGENPQCDGEWNAVVTCFDDYCSENPGEGICTGEPNE